MSRPAPVVTVEGLAKRYGQRQVLHGIDLEVDAGEVFCLLGPNGAGKTTTVEILEGFRAADAGRVRVLGWDPAGQPRDLATRIGVVPQQAGLPAYLTVRELLAAFASYYPAPRRVDDLLEIADLETSDPDPDPGDPGVGFLVAGMLAFGIITSCYGNVATTLTTLREEGILRRVRATPLPFGHYLAGHVGSALVTTMVLAVTLIAIGATVFDVSVTSDQAAAAAVVVLAGAAAFVPLGVALSAAIRSVDAANPAVNATYLPVVILSGLFFPLEQLPSWLDRTLALLPVERLAQALDRVLRTGFADLPLSDLAVLVAWGVGGTVVAARAFRWEPRYVDR